jgi:hypothetical protein
MLENNEVIASFMPFWQRKFGKFLLKEPQEEVLLDLARNETV